MPNFIRQYELIITASNGKRVTIKQQHIEFEVSKDTSSGLNTLDLRIYNLSKETIAVFDNVDAVIELRVGYKNKPLIACFVGNKTQHRTTRQSDATVLTHILASEGAESVKEGRCNITLPPNSTVADVIRAIGSEMGFGNFNLSGPTLNTTLPRGYSASGVCRTLLDQVCGNHNLAWYFGAGSLTVHPLKGHNGRKTTVVYAHQIKNTVEKNSKEVNDLKEDLEIPKKIGVNFTVLLWPVLEVGSLVELKDTFNSDGVYVIDKIYHRGEYEGSAWDTEVRCTAFEGGT